MGVTSRALAGPILRQRFPRTIRLLDGQRWEWSDAVARVLNRMINDAEPFSSKHRLTDTAGNVRQVVVVNLEQSRAVIEQAKGALMLVYGISADRGFDILTWRSQETNTRLRAIAEQLVSGFSECEPDTGLRTWFDYLLLTAHQRAGRPD